MNQEFSIGTKCKECETNLKFDFRKSVFYCPKCYDPYRSIGNIWCPYCGNCKFTRYSGERTYFICQDCQKIYNFWDGTQIVQKIEVRIKNLEKMNEIYKKIINNLFKEGGLTPKQQGIIQKSVDDLEFSFKLLGVDKDDIYRK